MVYWWNPNWKATMHSSLSMRWFEFWSSKYCMPLCGHLDSETILTFDSVIWVLGICNLQISVLVLGGGICPRLSTAHLPFALLIFHLIISFANYDFKISLFLRYLFFFFFVCEYDTYSIVTIKYDIITLIYIWDYYYRMWYSYYLIF